MTDDPLNNSEKQENEPPRLYANAVGVQTGAMDMAVDFAYQGGPDDWDGLVRVVMAWEEAVVLQSFLTEAIEGYEREIGPIRDMRKLIAEAQAEQSETEDENGNAD